MCTKCNNTGWYTTNGNPKLCPCQLLDIRVQIKGWSCKKRCTTVADCDLSCK